jgi:hypothetical protein
MINVSIDRQVMQSIMSRIADQLKSKIDLNHVKKLCKERYGIETIEGIEHKDGNIVVLKDQVAFKLDFEVRFPMSVLISTKENINSTLQEDNDQPAEVDAISEEIDDVIDELMK